MKFNLLCVIVPESKEEDALMHAKEAGAGAVTILKGNHIGLKEKKSFLGLTIEESSSVLVFILPVRLSMRVLKKLKDELHIQNSTSQDGISFVVPVSHVFGISDDEKEKFLADVMKTM